MKRFRTSAATCVAALATVSATGDTVIDTTPLWDGNESNGWPNIAQTFTVPGGDNVLSTFELGVYTDTGGNYAVRLYDWDEVADHAVGAALYDSGMQSATPTMSFVEFAINTALTSGETYAIIVQWDNGGSSSGVAFSGANQYPDGYNTYTEGSIFDPWAFGPNTSFEMAFRAVFTVPAPGALAMLGLAAMLQRRRRRS
jgi:MYXO-CTERM domain-containing protein